LDDHITTIILGQWFLTLTKDYTYLGSWNLSETQASAFFIVSDLPTPIYDSAVQSL
jgi:hypothetical protein